MKKQISMIMLLVVIGAMLLSGCITQTEEKVSADETDSASEGVAGAGGVTGVGIVTRDETSGDAFGEIGCIGESYAIGNVPLILVGSLDGLQIQDFRYEDGKFKFCIQNSKIRQDAILLTLSADQKTVHTISISTENGKTCYESSNLEYYLINPETIGIKEIKFGPMSKGIPAKKVSETVTGEEAYKEIGFIGRTYPVDNFPAILVPFCLGRTQEDSREKRNDELQLLNIRYENSKIKFCIKNSGTRPYEKVASANACSTHECCDRVGSIEIVVPPNEIRCYEMSTKHLEERRSKEIKFIAVSIR